MSEIITPNSFCEKLGWPAWMVPELINAFADRELAKLATYNARAEACAARPDNQALPLCDEGHEFGRVEARIPITLAGNLLARKGFGYEGLMSDEGIKDILRDNPVCRVETISGVTRSGWTPGRKTVKKYL